MAKLTKKDIGSYVRRMDNDWDESYKLVEIRNGRLGLQYKGGVYFYNNDEQFEVVSKKKEETFSPTPLPKTHPDYLTMQEIRKEVRKEIRRAIREVLPTLGLQVVHGDLFITSLHKDAYADGEERADRGPGVNIKDMVREVFLQDMLK